MAAKKISLLWFWPLIPAIILGGLVIVADRLEIFKIEKVDCRLNQYVCPLNLEPILLSFMKVNIFRFNSDSAERQLIAFDPTLTGIKIKKKLPDNLVIDLERRLPTAVVRLAETVNFSGLSSSDSADLIVLGSDKRWYIDRSGFVYRPAAVTGQNLPQIDWPASLALAEGESAESKNLAKLINTLAAYYVSFTSIARLTEEPVLVVVTAAGPYALIPADQDFAQPVGSLQFILTNIKIGERIPKKIDLRFDKPVLTY